MSIQALTTEPSALYAGDSINWLIALPDYPATGGWTLKYNAVCSAGQFAFSSVPSGADHAVTVVKATTAAYLPGSYSLTKYVEHSDGSRVTLSESLLTVKPDLAGKTAAFDNRGHVKKTLDAIEAVLEGRAAISQQELTIDGTTLKRTPVNDLLRLRSKYLSYWQQEQAAANLAAGVPGGSNKILVRFT